MKLADINPNTGLVHRKVGRDMKVSTWRIVDYVDCDGIQTREVWHHDTLMGEFYKLVPFYSTGQGPHEHEVFQFAPLSTGWGSVSDQKGLNLMLAGTGWRFVRKGGVPRYVHENGRYFPH